MYELWCDCGTKWPPDTKKKSHLWDFNIQRNNGKY